MRNLLLAVAALLVLGAVGAGSFFAARAFVAAPPLPTAAPPPPAPKPPPPPPSEPPPAPPPKPPEEARRGWSGEALPTGLSRGREEPVLVWDAGKGVPIELVHVPAGPFPAGHAQAPGSPPRTEELAHDYWIGRVPVTWRQFAAFVRATKRPEPQRPWFWEQLQGERDEHPVVLVSHADALAFARWLGLDLPTDHEFEKAARGTDGREFPWGAGVDGTRLNFSDAQCPGEMQGPGGKTWDQLGWRDPKVDDGYAFTSPVGSYLAGASPYGALDLAGNVWQWTATEVASGGQKTFLIRGGCWARPAAQAAAWHRSALPPAARTDGTGFRLCLRR